MNYPYKCKTCGTEFTIQMSVKKYEVFKVYCPICKSFQISRTYGKIAVSYKDDGFTKYIKEP